MELEGSGFYGYFRDVLLMARMTSTSGRVKAEHPFLEQYGVRAHRKGAEILLGNKGDTP